MILNNDQLISTHGQQIDSWLITKYFSYIYIDDTITNWRSSDKTCLSLKTNYEIDFNFILGHKIIIPNWFFVFIFSLFDGVFLFVSS